MTAIQMQICLTKWKALMSEIPEMGPFLKAYAYFVTVSSSFLENSYS